MRRIRHLSPLLALAAAAALTNCQLGAVPTEPVPEATPSATPSSGASPVAIPVVFGAPATPTPSPGATPTPAPTPTPEPTPAGEIVSSCSLPASSPANPVCTDDPNTLAAAVERALTKTTQVKPDIFDMNDTVCVNCYRVLNVDAYIRTFQKQLLAEGVCSYWDGEEIAAKGTNALSEQYDILTYNNYMRRMPGAYRGVCRPAIF